MKEFCNKIVSFIEYPPNGRGTKEQIEERKDRKNNSLASVIDLYNKLYSMYFKECKNPNSHSEEKYDYEKLKTFPDNKPDISGTIFKWLTESNVQVCRTDNKILDIMKELKANKDKTTSAKNEHTKKLSILK